MTFSTIVAIIGGIVTAGCAIAGAIAGIKARRAQERRDEEYRKAEHESRMNRFRNRAQRTVAAPAPVTTPQPTTTTNEVHYYYHAPNQQNPIEYYPQNTYQQAQNYYANNNQYMNQQSSYPNYGNGYTYGYAYNEPVYRGEREIGMRSKMELQQAMNAQYNPYQNSYSGYYYQPYYAYAV